MSFLSIDMVKIGIFNKFTLYLLVYGMERRYIYLLPPYIIIQIVSLQYYEICYNADIRFRKDSYV
jgi:hypothetical protein